MERLGGRLIATSIPESDFDLNQNAEPRLACREQFGHVISGEIKKQ
jgi:hypothetical protein